MRSPDSYVLPFSKLFFLGGEECPEAVKKAASAAAMYPSVWSLRKASVYEISEAAQISEDDALLLSVFAELLPRYIRSEDTDHRFILKSRETMLPYLNRLFLCQDAPCLFLFLFNEKRVLISEHKIQEGIDPPSSLQVSVAVRKALSEEVSFVVLAQYRAPSPSMGWKQLQPVIIGMHSVSITIEEIYQIDPGNEAVKELTHSPIDSGNDFNRKI